jgi:glutamate dehydrogenase
VVIKPRNTICYDEDDTYLVVAADKGTATFSDIANEIAQEYGFWLGDAFASGGGTGYDHKKMGITARGAWESVKHHFRSLNINIQETPFTVIGIGDMGGDVFGNGMLLSRQIKLVAAFNHVHIFIDPNPDPATSFEERQRLFNTRGGWSDYNKDLISVGGGVFSRTAKSIALTPEIKALLDVDKESMTPVDLMHTILKAKVDLFWNGGIGTFVKASTEQHTDVGDKANDLIRVNGNELRCRVLGEGGNLGVTQLARIEYELQGGLLNTDFIDNSGGVDCSDHEVNIKILLNSIVQRGDMTEKQRNHLLAEMTEDVAELVLAHNYRQNQSISVIHKQARDNLTVLARYMQAQERNGKLSRKLEFLPNDILLAERKANGSGLTRPEVAVLLSYSKNITKQQILESNVPEDPYLAQAIEVSFPERLREKYRDAMQSHTLKREMIATRLSNLMTDDMGIAFVYQLHERSGASISAIVRAYAAARQVFRITELRDQVSALDYKINAELQTQMLVSISQLVRSTTRWFLRNRLKGFNIVETVGYFQRASVTLFEKLPDMAVGQEKEYWDNLVASYREAGVSEETAMNIATIHLMFSALDIIDGANECGVSVEEFGTCYFALTDKLELSWIIKQIMEYTADDYWTIIARTALRDDIDWQRRALVTSILKSKTASQNLEQHINQWMEEHSHLIGRWHALLTEIKGAAIDITRLSVAVRLLTDLSAIGFRAIITDEERVL